MKASHFKENKTKLKQNISLNSRNIYKPGLKAIVLTIFYVFLVIAQNGVKANSLEEVDDKELIKLINQEQYVAVLFSDKGNTELTNEHEDALGAVREDLVDSLNAWVVKATTGDWLVHFLRDECDECLKLDARLETVACLHK